MRKYDFTPRPEDYRKNKKGFQRDLLETFVFQVAG